MQNTRWLSRYHVLQTEFCPFAAIAAGPDPPLFKFRRRSTEISEIKAMTCKDDVSMENMLTLLSERTRQMNHHLA